MKEKGFYLPEADYSRQLYIKEDPELAEVGHFHGGIEIIAVTEGEIEAFCIADKSVLKAGEIFFADSFVCHHYRKITPTIKAVVIVLSSEYTTIFKEHYKNKTFPTFMKDIDKNLELINIIKSWVNEKEKSFILNVGYTNILLSKMAERYELLDKEEKKEKSVSIKLLQYVNNHYCEDISLTSVSKSIGYSKEYCSKIFSEVVGMSFRDYLNFLRLKKAGEYFSLKDTNKFTTLEIIYKCGFNSAATFYRAQKAIKNKNIKF